MIAEAELLGGLEVPTGAELGRLQSVWSARAEQLQVCEGELNALDLESVGVEEYARLLSRRDAARRLSEWAASRAEGYGARLEECERERSAEHRRKCDSLKMMYDHLASARKSLSHQRSVLAEPPGTSFFAHNVAREQIPVQEADIARREAEIEEYRAAHPEIVAEVDGMLADELAELRRKLDEQLEADRAERERRSRNTFGW
jgi:hypothetical protein